jgi:hypothetical protein
LALLVNLFDLSIVLVLALAVHIRPDAPAAGAEAIQVPASRSELPKFRRADGKAEGDGTRLGIAYQLSNGEVVFVPEGK